MLIKGTKKTQKGSVMLQALIVTVMVAILVGSVGSYVLNSARGSQESNITKEVNLGRFAVRLTGGGVQPVCTGTRAVEPAAAQVWGAVSAELCDSMGLQIDISGQSCRVPADHILGRVNPGPCAADEHVNSVRPDAAAGESRTDCRAFPAQGCAANELAVGFIAGNIACAAEPPSLQVTNYPTITSAPTAQPSPAYQATSPTPFKIPDPQAAESNDVSNFTCPAAISYQNCMDALAMGGTTQFGITSCGPAPSCYAGVTVQPTPNSATPFPTATPTPVIAVVTPPPAGCLCGGQSVPNGAYCGYCYIAFEPEPMPYRGGPSYQLNRAVDGGFYNYDNSSVVQCVNGQLVATTQQYNMGLGCTGDYVSW